MSRKALFISRSGATRVVMINALWYEMRLPHAVRTSAQLPDPYFVPVTNDDPIYAPTYRLAGVYERAGDTAPIYEEVE